MLLESTPTATESPRVPRRPAWKLALSPLPFAHVGYMTRMWDELVHRITTVITPTPWKAAGALRLIEEERVTVNGEVAILGRRVEAVTFDGVHDRLTGWFAGAAVLRSELAAGMDEKEAELRKLGLEARMVA